MLKEERTTCCVAGHLAFLMGAVRIFRASRRMRQKIQGATLLLLPDDHARLPRVFSPSLIFRRMGAALQITRFSFMPASSQGSV
jgi:hypothetical protein